MRLFLSRYSPPHAARFRQEEAAATSAQHHWRRRLARRQTFEARLEAQLKRWELDFAASPWDPLTRALLAYFAPRKWRALFVFENATARKIQNW